MARARKAPAALDPVAAIEAGDIAPVNVLYGDEPEGVARVLRALRAAVPAAGMEAFDHERFEGRTLTSIAPVLAACAQLPVGGARRLVELADPDQVGDKKSSGYAKGEDARRALDALVAYLEAPNPTTVLVLSGKGIDGRSRLVTRGRKAGVVHKFGALAHDREAVAWLEARARALGGPIDSDAAAALVAAVGLSPSQLALALDNASLHAGPGARVTLADVEAVVPQSRQTVVFDLTDAVGMGDAARALAVLRRIFDERAMPERAQALALVSMLARQVRLVWVARVAGGRTAQVAKVPPFVARKLERQARRFDEARLRRAHEALVRLDLDLKGGSEAAARAPRLALERWVLETCGGLPGVAPRA